MVLHGKLCGRVGRCRHYSQRPDAKDVGPFFFDAANMPIPDLERRALELVKHGDFGAEAVRVNAAITALAPTNAAAWTRLGRCHLEQRQFDEAVTAFAPRSAESDRHNRDQPPRRSTEAARPHAERVERATTGFGAREFAVIAHTRPRKRAARSRLVSTRSSPRQHVRRRGTHCPGARIVRGSRVKVFQANSCHPGATGHIQAFHHGGRWEPQFNIGWFSSPPLASNCFRAGIGFNLSPPAANPTERPRRSAPSRTSSVSTDHRASLETGARAMDGGKRRVHSVSRGRARDRAHARTGGGLAAQLPQRRLPRVGLRRTMAVSRSPRRRHHSCGSIEARSVRRRCVPNAFPPMARRLQ